MNKNVKEIEKRISISQITPSKTNPRTIFKEKPIEDLAESIKNKGLIQSIVVRPTKGKKDNYELVCGERRFRATKKAKLKKIRARILNLTDELNIWTGVVGIPQDKFLRIEQSAVLITLNAIGNSNHSVNAGWAVDECKILQNDAHGELGMTANIAVRDTDGFFFRVGYYTTVIGKFKDAPIVD